MPSKPITGRGLVVEYLKWPSDLHYRCTMMLLGEDATGIWVGARAGDPVERGDGKPGGVASADSVTLFPHGHGWSARWYSAPASAGRAAHYSCYVDITTPPERVDNVVRAIDLDLDVVRTWDGEVAVLDEDEFAHNRSVRGYPPAMVTSALQSATYVRKALASKEFPLGTAPPAPAAGWFDLSG
jgi:protein associated with RNAse G/E